MKGLGFLSQLCLQARQQCPTGLHWGFPWWPPCVLQEKTSELLIRADQLWLYGSLINGSWVSQTHCNCSIISKLWIPNDQILIKIPLLIPGQESIWELGRSDEGTDMPKQGRTTCSYAKGQHPGMLNAAVSRLQFGTYSDCRPGTVLI